MNRPSLLSLFLTLLMGSLGCGAMVVSEGSTDAAMADDPFGGFEVSPGTGDVSADADATVTEVSPGTGDAFADADATAANRSLVTVDGSDVEVLPSDAGPCPDGSFGFGPMPACDVASQGWTCRFPVLEGTVTSLEGQWYECGGYGRLCYGHMPPPEGARCCSSDLMMDRLGFSACCVGGQVLGCDNHHVVYTGKCVEDAGDDAWGFHRVPDASPDVGGD
jgi:hypothetical protein